MNLRELVGKQVMRTKPVILNNGYKDYSFTDLSSRITVLNVVNDVPIIEIEWESPINKTSVESISLRLDDDNWKDVSDAYEYVQKANEAIEKINKRKKR